MNLTIYGTGYVGLVTGACLAEVGHNVICMDIDAAKIELLQSGQIPIWEPGLDVIVERNVSEGRLRFTTDIDLSVAHGQAQFIAVGTPPDENGAADLKYVVSAAEKIAERMAEYKAIITKSTVPVGTCSTICDRVGTILATRGVSVDFDIISNPEFLKEGSAVADFLNPDRIIVGADSDPARGVLTDIYEPFTRDLPKLIFMAVRSSELTKYAANALLATKISFINEIANIAERLGADIEEVRKGIAADPRIGPHFISPGAGYGGSCFPKDVQALARTAETIGYGAQLLNAVEAVNNDQKRILFNKLVAHFGGADQMSGKTVAVWGLAFKPNTDDMREAPSRTLMEALWSAGARVRAFDPAAQNEARRIYGERPDFILCDDQYHALEGADALVVCTEWQEFRASNLIEIGRQMPSKVIVDGRNIFSLRQIGLDWSYYGVGRHSVKGPFCDDKG